MLTFGIATFCAGHALSGLSVLEIEPSGASSAYLSLTGIGGAERFGCLRPSFCVAPELVEQFGVFRD